MKFRAFPLSEPELEIVPAAPVRQSTVPQEILFDIKPRQLDLPKIDYSEPNLGPPDRKES